MYNKVLLIITFLSFFVTTAFTQNTYTLDNNPGAPSNYKTLQGALDSVPGGSIILIQPSSHGYGIGNVTKPLAIYGAGYFLGQNAAPNTQAILMQVTLNSLSFSAGSQGSILSGVSFEYSTGDGLLTRINFVSTNNISISRCKFQILGSTQGFYGNNANNINISQCFIHADGQLVVGPAFNFTFKNNIVECTNIGIVGNAQNFTCTFLNNSFRGNIGELSFENCTFINNIIMCLNPAATRYIDVPMTYADHNVSNVNIFPAGGVNITNADEPNTYTLYSNPAISSSDGIYQLKPGSVAIGYGTDGTDAGAYGTTNMRYVFSGIPAIPNIYFANPQQVGTTSGGLKIQLKIKANN